MKLKTTEQFSTSARRWFCVLALVAVITGLAALVAGIGIFVVYGREWQSAVSTCGAIARWCLAVVVGCSLAMMFFNRVFEECVKERQRRSTAPLKADRNRWLSMVFARMYANATIRVLQNKA